MIFASVFIIMLALYGLVTLIVELKLKLINYLENKRLEKKFNTKEAGKDGFCSLSRLDVKDEDYVCFMHNNKKLYYKNKNVGI